METLRVSPQIYKLGILLFWFVLGHVSLAQFQTGIVHNEGFTLRYGSGFLAQGGSDSTEIIFRPTTGTGLIRIRLLFTNKNSRLDWLASAFEESLKICFTANRVCQPPISVEPLSPGFSGQTQSLLQLTQQIANQTSLWRVYAVDISRAQGKASTLLIWAEGENIGSLLQVFWQNLQVVIR